MLSIIILNWSASPIGAELCTGPIPDPKYIDEDPRFAPYELKGLPLFPSRQQKPEASGRKSLDTLNLNSIFFI